MSAQIRWFTIIALIYAAVSGCAHMSVNSVLFQPGFGSHRAVAGQIAISTDDGVELAALHLPNPQARFTIWYFHGNAEDLGDIEPFLKDMRDRGFSVFAYDYPGYGRSGGSPSEQSVYAANRAARAYLHDVLKVPASRVIVYGSSVGTGPAIDLAAQHRFAGLVVRAGFLSVYRVVTRWPLLPGDRFRNLAKIRKVSYPVLMMHGRQDEVIPFYHGEKLFAAAREPKRHLWVDGAHHNDFLDVAGERHWAALQEFSELCAKTADEAERR